MDGAFKPLQKHANGHNGDLWTLVYEQMKQISVDVVKVKPHVSDQDMYDEYGMDDIKPCP